MDPFAAAAGWITAQLWASAVAASKKRGATAAAELVFGPALERALREPTRAALREAVRDSLGDRATPDSERRTAEVLAMTWTDRFTVHGRGNVLEQVRAVASQGIAAANAPVLGLPSEFATTSSLTALSEELGVRLDPDDFAEAFVRSWAEQVRHGALGDARLVPVADRLDDDRLLAHVRRLETRLDQLLREATQSALDRDRGLSLTTRHEWFSLHVEPAHAQLRAICDDYVTGFLAAARRYRADDDIAGVVRSLTEHRRGLALSRVDLQRTVDVLGEHGLHEGFGPAPVAAFGEYVLAAQRLLYGASNELDSTWYSHYIAHFQELEAAGLDPHDRHQYAIAGPDDLADGVYEALRRIATGVLPAHWSECSDHYARLRALCLAL